MLQNNDYVLKVISFIEIVFSQVYFICFSINNVGRPLISLLGFWSPFVIYIALLMLMLMFFHVLLN